MGYDIGQLSKIKAKVFAKIAHEFELATENDSIEEFLQRYDVIFEEECIPVNTRTMRILVFGALAGNVNNYKSAARSLGINPENIEFENDYEKLTNYDCERLRNSFDYSDIIIGCNPHKIKNLGAYRSLVSKIKAEQSQFPRLIESLDPHSFKLSVSGFKNCLIKTRYFENLSN